MKHALVTGGSGYLGSHVCKLLKNSGWKVSILDIKFPRHYHVDTFFQADIRDKEALKEIFYHHQYDVVFHFAGKIDVSESTSSPTDYYDVNTAGTCNLLNVMNSYGVKNIIYSSTAAVYETRRRALFEDDTVSPKNSPYAGSKLAAEYAISQSKTNHIIFRYFNLAGADPDGELGENHDPETHLIPKMIQNLNNFELYGNDYNTFDGTCIRDYVHVSDVADAHLKAFDYLNSGGGSTVLNLGSGLGYSVLQIKDIVENIVGKKITYKEKPRRPGDPDVLIASINKAKKTLNFSPKNDIVAIVQTAFDWHNR
jgi:UDP-glucose-4-epimerase GalE